MATISTPTPVAPLDALPRARATPPQGIGRFIDLDTILMMCQRDLVRFARERTQLYGSVARTVLWLFILGAGLRGSVTVPGGISYLQFVFPGMLALTIIFTSMQSAISIIFDREFGFLKEILVAPVPRTSVVLGKAVAGAATATILGTLLFVFAPFVGVWPGPLQILASIGVMLLTGVGLTGMGILIAARMTSFEGFGTINNFVVLPLYFTSAAQFPIDRAPEWLKVLAHFNPLTYAVDLLRGILVGVWTYNAALDLAVLAGFAVIVIVGATWSFTRQE